MSNKNVALSKKNLIICGIAVLLIIIGFVLMTGPSTSFENGFESEIFSARRIKLAPVVCLAGFVLMIVGILYPTKEYKSEKEK
ncbi:MULTISPECIES: DUF3098 domain-containing protein [Proteiniphilum]|jgi:uncharacterized membrane protein|uniref:DUF3098 domain-containing protein n=1 Tax=Proteiniphilum TaxID=294702 RepID=UPI001EEB3989|nr:MULTISPECIES: DUF3098 domain-containing protein [Proteiniphilum]MDD2245523.1 DUF3098 domain-containing protein [Proteiniphilum sp.]MDD3908341.1 DUF3098 domain-containing protein [Proteiniphilum sp.]MDD4415177.1 DUF3098 domain-containing protein [Proteiniphilum sp.]ULB33835.1 DUF3098 domain-containing protein [Proteiniphilum propionicum]